MLSKKTQAILAHWKGDLALAFSGQAEDVVALDLLRRIAGLSLEVFMLDTQKHFPETQDFYRAVERHFGIVIRVYLPAAEEVRALENDLGQWGMRHSLENRKRCCAVRKVAPLKLALADKSGWVTGQRAEQAPTRQGLREIEFDDNFGLMKFNPLAHWQEADVAAHVRAHGLPTHPLYAQGFRSIGCAPCTRAVAPGQAARAGRWWWEDPEHKECGLHERRAA
ncbi:MAG: phosphoadenylyl-sulfate reductase [Zoogloeaceae bacterium]|jgi:phosphoadenosine phosphosulfate reductase|nr:phosphoadenylyl-sulfate reductase [Zoogloeaceae bacterium]